MNLLVLVAQIVLGGYFLMGGLNHFRNKAAIAGYAQSRAVPSPDITVPLTGVMLIVAGVSVLLGLWVPVGAWLGIIFLLLAAYFVHHYWRDEGMQRVGEMVNFQKNLALAAALYLASLLPADLWAIRLGR